MMSQLNNASALIADFDKTVHIAIEESPEWLKLLRRQSAARFQELGIPTVKDEEWKYTNLSDVSARSFVAGDAAAKVAASFLESYAGDKIRLTFIDGHYRQDLSVVPAQWPQGVSIVSLQNAAVDRESDVKKTLSGFDSAGQTAFQALNEALWRDGLYIRTEAKTTAADHLIHIVHVSTGKNQTYANPRTVVHMGALSEASVLESHITVDDQSMYFVNAMTDVYLENGAVLNYCKAQKDGAKAIHINNTRILCERAARFNGFTLTTSTGLTRNDLNAVLNGEGSDATLRSLYSMYDHQHVDNHTFVEHRVPNCTSNQLYKGILNGSSRAVFNGKILVKSEAQQTNSYQLNKTLMLGKNARIDTKPQLEIFADDVKCTHGATIGHLDEEQMFYLQSRCIPKDQATMILARGFADDVLGYIPRQDIQDKMHFLLEPSMAVIGI